MKKLLAVLMSIVMMFTLVALPVSAAGETADETANTVTVEEFFTTLETTIMLIQDTIVQVHFIVGTILGVLQKDCPLCGTVHEYELNSDETDDSLKAPVEVVTF